MSELKPYAALAIAVGVLACFRSVGAPPPSAESSSSARARAPYDLTGYWVSVVTQDWRFRMVLPAKGEYNGIPINLAAKQFADAWSPALDEASGQQCKAYGVGALMRIPERLHITWQDDNTLKVETDAGQQIRYLRFAASSGNTASAPSLQGSSIATWELPRITGRTSLGGDPAIRGPGADLLGVQSARVAGAAKFGSIKVETRNASPGYLRKNGIPYGSQMTMTEYWDLRVTDAGQQWLAIATELDDPQYLQSPYVFAPNFKREPNGAKWDPSPCTLQW